MLALPFGIILMLLTIMLIKKEPRRFANAVCLMTSLTCVIHGLIRLHAYYYPALEATGSGEAVLTQAGEAGSLLWMTFLFLVLIAGVALIVNGIILIRKESLNLAHLLPVLFGCLCMALVIIYYGYIYYVTSGIPANNMTYFIAYLIIYLECAVCYVPFTLIAYLIYSLVYRLCVRTTNPSYLIILGASLSGKHVSPLLAKRLDKAIILYYKNKEQPFFVVSGGQGKDEKISEAEAMKNYLLEKKIPSDKIYMEDQSANTYQNMKYSRAVIERVHKENDHKGIFVTNNFHVLRSAIIARNAGLKVDGVGCGTAGYYYPAATIREAIAFVFGYKKLVAAYLLLLLIYEILGIAFSNLAAFLW